MNNLEQQKTKMLLEKEEQWRLKSRAISLQARDGNRKFFHNFANCRKATNMIQQRPRDPDGWATTHPQLARFGNTHFKRLFTAPTIINLPDIINLVGNFPRFVEPEVVEDLIQPVTMVEIEGTLKWVKKDKSSCPDAWLVEFCSPFLEFLGKDLLAVIEESRITRHIHPPPMNYTFIALIPEND